MTEKLTLEQAFLCTAVSGILMMDVDDFKRMASERLGSQILTHDMADRQFWDGLNEAVLDDFYAIVPGNDLRAKLQGGPDD